MPRKGCFRFAQKSRLYFAGGVKGCEDDFVTEFNRKIFSVLLSRAKSGRSVDITALNSDFTSEEIGRIAEISSKGSHEGEHP